MSLFDFAALHTVGQRGAEVGLELGPLLFAQQLGQPMPGSQLFEVRSSETQLNQRERQLLQQLLALAFLDSREDKVVHRGHLEGLDFLQLILLHFLLSIVI